MRISLTFGFILIFVFTLLSLIYTAIFIKGIIIPSFLKSERGVLKKVYLTIESNCSKDKQETRINYYSKYPFVLDCRNKYNPWTIGEENKKVYDYNKPSPTELHDLRIIRGIVVHFPIDKVNEYMSELKWLFNSWIYMQKFEPSKWRTDLVVFTENNKEIFSKKDFFLNELNCSFSNRRTNSTDKPMCTLINYKPIIKRDVQQNIVEQQKRDPQKLYDYFLNELNIFSNNSNDFIPFYNFIIEKTNKYPNTDSLLVAFDGYEYFKSAGFDFLLRTDMDVFLTPLFGQWTPINCNSFYAGRGGYSTEFNMNRLGRIANDLNLEYAKLGSIGSSWYSTPEQLRLASYLSVFLMGYLASVEFSQPEREGKLGIMLWPDWHYGVLSMYGAHLALNHMLGEKNFNLVLLPDHLDFPSENTESIFKKLHIHVFHGSEIFSKFAFKNGNYDKMPLEVDVPRQVKLYALQMALESKKLSNKDLFIKFVNQTLSKS